MIYKVDIQLRRFLDAKSFARDLKQLRAFRGRFIGDGLLEALEKQGLLKPKLRLQWPDTVARRMWFERHSYVGEMREPVEPDGARWDAAVSLSNELSAVGFSRAFRAAAHPFDTPTQEHRQFLLTPDQQVFLPHRERRVSVANRHHPELYDNGNVSDFYSSWQLLHAAEVADMGVHISVNMSDHAVAKRVHEAIQAGRLPEGVPSFLFDPMRAMGAFADHQMALDAIVWSAEEANIGLARILKGSGGGRLRLTQKQLTEYEEVRLAVARESRERFDVSLDGFLKCCGFLAERWSVWSSEGRPYVADAYKVFTSACIRLVQLTEEMSFEQVKEAIGVGRFGPCRTLETMWPDWAEEQIARLILTLRGDDLSEEQVRSFGQFLREEYQDAVFLRLESFERHAFNDVEAPLAGMRSDLQGMSVAVEQAVRAMGGSGTQLGRMFLELWCDSDVGTLLRRNKTLLEQGRPPEELKAQIDQLRTTGGAATIAADLILAARVRGAVHHELKIDDQFELEQMAVRVLRAAALTHAHVTARTRPSEFGSRGVPG